MGFDFLIFLELIRFFISLVLLPIKLLLKFMWTFKKETGWFFILLIPSIAWKYGTANSFLSMELNLLSKLGWEVNYDTSIVFIILGINFVLIFGRKINHWTRAAFYGYASCMLATYIVYELEYGVNNNLRIPRMLVFVLILAIILFSMYIGFHKFDILVETESEVLDLLIGIVPSLLCSFITFCTLFTITFENAVENSFSYVIWVIVLELVIYGAGIALFFIFQDRYMSTIVKRMGGTETEVEIAE